MADAAMQARFVLRLTAEQREKLTRLGGSAWVREQIERAKEPTPRP
jgi:hypothetical protein